ncbi:O-methyltransferase MdmC-like [Pecten maximus]|uniref:O-methyltransferase MdmC-like n=1 Tax=Pecten maximus TaxID=6579 RepID=UPI0014585E03|nr:O-methyltransferase MdmC-like [Pecten maximus]
MRWQQILESKTVTCHQSRIHPPKTKMAFAFQRHCWAHPVLRHLVKLRESAKPRGVPEDIQTQIQTCIDCILARDDYCDEISSPVSEDIDNLIKESESHPWKEAHNEGKVELAVSAAMLSGSLEGTFLKTLVGMSNSKRVLEVGLFTGCGALAMAEALPADGKVVTCELSEYVGDVARKLVDQSPHGKKIEILIGPAKGSLEQLAVERQQFDMVFIDANKEGYIDYYKIIMDNDMLTPRGTILIDNALHGGQAYLPKDKLQLDESRIAQSHVMREFNDYVYNDNRVSQVMVPIRDGVMMIRRKEAFEGEA